MSLSNSVTALRKKTNNFDLVALHIFKSDYFSRTDSAASINRTKNYFLFFQVDMASVLDQAIDYVKSLQLHVNVRFSLYILIRCHQFALTDNIPLSFLPLLHWHSSVRKCGREPIPPQLRWGPPQLHFNLFGIDNLDRWNQEVMEKCLLMIVCRSFQGP